MTEAEMMLALSEGHYAAAYDAAIQAHEPDPDRYIPFDLNEDVLPLIFTVQPFILWELPLTSWPPLRIAAAMLFLTGRSRARRWIPDGLPKHAWLDHEACCRMLLFAAQHMANLTKWRASGVVVAVKVLGGGKLCEACTRDDRNVYPLYAAPALPHAECTCAIGCPCCLAPVVRE